VEKEEHPNIEHLYAVEVGMLCAIRYSELYGHTMPRDRLFVLAVQYEINGLLSESEFRPLARMQSKREAESCRKSSELISVSGTNEAEHTTYFNGITGKTEDELRENAEIKVVTRVMRDLDYEIHSPETTARKSIWVQVSRCASYFMRRWEPRVRARSGR
jgi:3-dehydroquinate synthetase